MIEALSKANWLAVLVASIAHFILGGVWFAAIFGRQYAQALGLADSLPQKPSPLFLIEPFVCGAVTIATTAVLLRALGVTTYGAAFEFASVVGIGYLAAMTLNIAINPLFPRPFAYALINSPMFIIGSLMASAILVAMG